MRPMVLMFAGIPSSSRRHHQFDRVSHNALLSAVSAGPFIPIRSAMNSFARFGSVLRALSLAMLVLMAPGFLRAQQIPVPEDYFGFKIGADKKLVRYDKIVEYLTKIASLSDRVRIHTLGPTTNGNPFVMLEISSAGNIKNIEHYKSLERKLYFQGGTPTDAERDEIFRDGKAVVLVANNIHSTEIGASQMVIEAVYRLATDNSPELQKIFDNDILVLVASP